MERKISATRKKKPVIGINDKGEQIYFDTIRSVTKEGFDSKAVINCCKGRQKTHKGYKWNYVTEADKEVNADNKGVN